MIQQTQCQIVENTQVAEGVFSLIMEAPRIAAAAKPGQFVHVRPGPSADPLLRRPFGISRVSGGLPGRPSRVHVLYQVVGRGTGILSGAVAGQSADIIGPLGHGFRLRPSTRRLLLVAGGMGVAPLIGASEAALAAGLEVVLLAGARDRWHLLPTHLLPSEVELQVATEDGTSGHRGLVTELLGDYVAWADQVFVCGPNAMLLPLRAALGKKTAVCQVSLEERMACGVGACLGCTVETRRGQATVCRDGPVFELRQLLL